MSRLVALMMIARHWTGCWTAVPTVNMSAGRHANPPTQLLASGPERSEKRLAWRVRKFMSQVSLGEFGDGYLDV